MDSNNNTPIFAETGEIASLCKKIAEQIKGINLSFHFDRTISKAQKVTVLDAASRYLNGRISRESLEKIVAENPHYSDAIGKSRTRDLVAEVLAFRHAAT